MATTRSPGSYSHKFMLQQLHKLDCVCQEIKYLDQVRRKECERCMHVVEDSVEVWYRIGGMNTGEI